MSNICPHCGAATTVYKEMMHEEFCCEGSKLDALIGKSPIIYTTADIYQKIIDQKNSLDPTLRLLVELNKQQDSAILQALVQYHESCLLDMSLYSIIAELRRRGLVSKTVHCGTCDQAVELPHEFILVDIGGEGK